MQKKNIILIFFLCVSMSAMAQMDRDLAGVDYVNLKQGNQSDGVDFERYNFRMTLPKRLKNGGGMLLNKFEYARTNISYAIDPNLDGDVSHFHSISYTFGFIRPLKKDWTLITMMSPSISSNFASSIQWDDIRLFGMVMFSKSLKSDMKLNFGVRYSSTIGKPFPLPMVSLMWNPSDKWTLMLGFPRIDVQYQLTRSTRIGTDFFMAGDNYTLGEDVPKGDNMIDNISVMNMGGGLKLTQKLSKHLKLNLSSGYTFYRKFEFLDGNDNVMEYDLDNNFYVKAGLSIGI